MADINSRRIRITRRSRPISVRLEPAEGSWAIWRLAAETVAVALDGVLLAAVLQRDAAELLRLLRGSIPAKLDAGRLLDEAGRARLDKVQRRLRLLLRGCKFMCSMGRRLCLSLLLRLRLREQFLQASDAAVRLVVEAAAVQRLVVEAEAAQVVEGLRPRAVVRLLRRFR